MSRFDPTPQPPPIVIVGATATGKSAAAAHVAAQLGGEVLSCDASCAYRGLDVATAKPGPELRALAPHHGLDACDPRELFSAARFVALAEETLRGATARQATVVIAGGTGLYLRTLLLGLVPSPRVDARLRARLLARDRGRPGALGRIARRLDPAAAERLSARDTLRLVRIVEHRLLAGTRLSADQAAAPRSERFPTRKVGLRLPRAAREARIRERVERMFRAGLVEEIEGLLASGVPRDAPAFRALGCREVLGVLAGHHSVAEAKDMLVAATRRYAKRQDTWFRSEPGVLWIDLAGTESPEAIAAAVVAAACA